MKNARAVRILVWGPCLLLLGAGSVSATIDDLEDIGPDLTVITSREIEGVTVSISTTTGNVFRAATYFDATTHAFTGAGDVVNAPQDPANLSGTRFISTTEDFNLDTPIVFEFSIPVSTFGLTTLDILEDVLTSPDAQVKLQGFDGNNLVVEDIRTGIHGSSGIDLDWVITTGGGMTRAVLDITAGYVSPGYGIDDLVLMMATVPVEPSTWGGIKTLYR